MFPLFVRHTKLFLKDKASVFFSILSVLIIILLYILFLAENISSYVADFAEREVFTFLWMFAGILAVTTATTPLGALGRSIEDKVSKRNEDLLMAPIKRNRLVYSYIVYSFFIGFFLTALLLIFGYSYVYVKYTIILELPISIIGVLLLSLLMHTLLFYLIVSRLQTMAAFSGFSTILGTLIGFLAGIYVPIGLLPTYIQKMIMIFPTTQTAVLLRNFFLDDILVSFKNVLPKETYQEIVKTLGVEIYWNGELLSSNYSWIYLLGLTVFLLLIIFIFNRSS